MSKISYEDKINIYRERKHGIHNIQYLERLIDKHGYDILRTTMSLLNKNSIVYNIFLIIIF